MGITRVGNLELITVEPPARPLAGVKCRECARDLGELGEQDCCPQCGLPVLISAGGADPGQALDARGVVAGDTACHKCGYNLRGLPRDGRCPECATAVSVSIRADLLCFAEPGYVRRLAQGNRWVVIGLNVAAVSLVVLIALGIGLALTVGNQVTSWLPRWLNAVTSAAPAVVGAGIPIGIAVYLVGVLLITTPEPRMFSLVQRDHARRLVRVCLLVAAVGMALHFGIDALVSVVAVLAASALLALLCGALGVVGVAAYFLYLRNLAERIPDGALAKAARQLAKNFALALGVIVLLTGITQAVFWGAVLLGGPRAVTPAAGVLQPSRVETAWHTVSGCATAAAELAVLVCFFRAAKLHRELDGPLQRQARFAARHWAADSRPATTAPPLAAG